MENAEPKTLLGASRIAAYLGVTTTTISNWILHGTIKGFPGPEVQIMGHAGKIIARGWSEHQIPDMRSWMEKRLDMDSETATAHWSLVDAAACEKERLCRDSVHADQDMLPMEFS